MATDPGGRGESQVLWRLTETCGFRCEYCPRVDARAEGPDPPPPPPARIAECFDATGRAWLVRFTGGEPFLYPGFLDLAAALTGRHRIAINTNLVSPDARRLAGLLDPARVHAVNATLHVHEVERRRLGDEWLDTYLHLQSAGFPMRALLLTHPDLLPGLGERVAELHARGVARTRVKALRGPLAGRLLPDDYTRLERRRIRALAPNDDEIRILADRVHYLGLRCLAGCTAFALDRRGNFTRCNGVATPHGNLFAGTFVADPAPRRCPAWSCSCPYQGARFAERTGVHAAALDLAAPAARRLLLAFRGSRRRPRPV